MEEVCLHCGNAFTAIRTTKKYCSDNCKQMAYFNRKGIVFGLGNLPSIKKGEDYSVKQDQINLIHKPTTVKQDFIVKQEDEGPSLIDFSVKSESEIDNSDHFTVKDDKITVKPDFIVKEKINVKYDKPIDATSNLENESVDFKKEISTKLFPKDLTPVEKVVPIPEQKYEWIHSKFYIEIEDFNELNEGSIDYSLRDENINWVNVRLRCIIENAIRLNEYAFVDRESLLQLKEALSSVIQSVFFKNLSIHYPYQNVTLELFERLHQYLRNRSEQIALRYSFTLKARLVSMQNSLKEIVPKIKFDELDFIEPQNQHFIQGINKNTPIIKQSNKAQQSANWEDRYKHYVQSGLIDADQDYYNKNDEDQAGNFDEESNNSRTNHYSQRLKHFKRTGKFP